MNNLVDVRLDVSVEEEVMIARLQFINATSKKVYLDEETICFAKEVWGNPFLIEDENGRIVSYKGMMGKRIIDPAYFQHLDPGQKIETSANLNKIYKVEKGHKYVVQYAIHHPYYLKEQEGFDFRSNKVEILYQ
jgi:hypothetical protein